jgi:hypothetical protein
MKSCPRIVLVLILCGCVGCVGGRAPARHGPSAEAANALEVLKQRQPETKWDTRSLLRADLDLDGGEDYAVLGKNKDRFVVGIVHGPVKAEKKEVWTLDFPWHGGEDALCSKRARISLESLVDNEGPKPGLLRQGVGINLSDDECDAFHIYWNLGEKTFEWWRL